MNDTTPDLNHTALRTWLRLLACYKHIEAHLSSHLRKEFGTTLPRFDMMAQLARSSDGLRMRDLSRKLTVTGGNITGLTDRMVDEGLISRLADPTDRRAYIVCLTDKGRVQFAAMALQHELWVNELFEKLDTSTLKQVSVQLDHLKRSLK